jgi:hypothetical protein
LETGLLVKLIEIGKIGEPVNGRWAWVPEKSHNYVCGKEHGLGSNNKRSDG